MNAHSGTKDECCISSVSFVFWVIQFRHMNIYCYKLIITTYSPFFQIRYTRREQILFFFFLSFFFSALGSVKVTPSMVLHYSEGFNFKAFVQGVLLLSFEFSGDKRGSVRCWGTDGAVSTSGSAMLGGTMESKYRWRLNKKADWRQAQNHTAKVLGEQ